jgi:hypothetical protein
VHGAARMNLLEGQGEAVAEGGELGLERHPARQPRLHLPWGEGARGEGCYTRALPKTVRGASLAELDEMEDDDAQGKWNEWGPPVGAMKRE